MPENPFTPSKANVPELMHLSKARPPAGDLDLTGFAPASHSAKSVKGQKPENRMDTYLERAREEDPWPSQNAFREAGTLKVQILACTITTGDPLLVFDRPVQVTCRVDVLQDPPDDASVRFHLQYKNGAAGVWHDLQEVVSCAIPAGLGNHDMQLELTLQTPYPVPMFGQEVFFRAEASNRQAAAIVMSPERKKAYRKLTEFVGAPEISFPEGSLVPVLGADRGLVRAMAAALRKLAAFPQADSDRVIVLGFSTTEKSHQLDRGLAKWRALALQSILSRDQGIWDPLGAHVTLSDFQRLLQGFNRLLGWNCDPVDLHPNDSPPPQTILATQCFQKRAKEVFHLELKPNGEWRDRPTWGAIHRTLCALVSQELGQPLESAPTWQTPAYHPSQDAAAFPVGRDFPQGERGAEILLFHPVDAPTLQLSPGPLTLADVPVEDPACFQKVRIEVPAASAPARSDRAKPELEIRHPDDPTRTIGHRGRQILEVRQWVNKTTAAGQDGRDGNGPKVRLNIVSEGYLEDQARARPLVERLYVRATFSSDTGHADRCPRSDIPFGLDPAGLENCQPPAAANLTRNPPPAAGHSGGGGWQTIPPNGWVYTGEIAIGADQKMTTIGLDLGIAGGDTCEVWVGDTPECNCAGVRLVNWRELQYDVQAPNNMVELPGIASGNPTLPAAIQTKIDERLGSAYVRYSKRNSGVFDPSLSAEITTLPARFFDPGTTRVRDEGLATWDLTNFTTPRFAAAPDTLVQITLADRLVSGTIHTHVTPSMVLDEPVKPYWITDMVVDPARLSYYYMLPPNSLHGHPLVVTAGRELVADIAPGPAAALPTIEAVNRIEEADPTLYCLTAFSTNLESSEPPIIYRFGQSAVAGPLSAGTLAVCQEFVERFLDPMFLHDADRKIHIDLTHPAGAVGGATQRRSRPKSAGFSRP